MESYATLLQRFRTRGGLSQRALAKATGIGHVLLSRSELGERTPADRAEIEQVAGVLELTSDERDLLLASAGYWPLAFEQLGPGDETLRAVADALTRATLAEDARRDLRQAIALIVRLATHDAAPPAPPASRDNAPPAPPAPPPAGDDAPTGGVP